MRKFLALVLVMLMISVPVFAASVDAMNDNNTYVAEDGSIYTYQDEKVYKLVDGKLYEVVNGTEQSIIDIMKQKPGSDVPDEEIMGDANSFIGNTIGLALSVIIYVFFALTAFTTACDLLYIGVPGIRPTLYDGGQGNRMYQSQMGGMQQGQGVVEQPKGRCLISNELKSIMFATPFGNNYGGVIGQQQTYIGNRNVILTYLKRRAVSIVVIVVVFMLLVTSTVFTDFGLNIGNMIYRCAAKFLGF